MKSKTKARVKIKPFVVKNDLYSVLLTEIAELIYDSLNLSKFKNSTVTESKDIIPIKKGAVCGSK